MNKKQIEMIRFLSHQDKPITSNALANALQVTSRSIKNYVHEINGLYGKNIILSSRSGYELNPSTDSSLLFSNDYDSIPQTNEERSFYIIKQLILNHTSHLDIFDLCDFLCVSYSTIKAVISRMNKTFSAYHIEFICENDYVKIQGSEYNKRKLISYVINEEAKNSYINTNILCENFTQINVPLLQSIINKTFKKHNYYLNDFAAVNLLLHLLIIIDRELNGNQLDSGRSNFEIDTLQERSFLDDLNQQIEDVFHIELNDYEKFEIYMLFKANANFSLDTSNDDLKKVVGEEIIALTNEYVKKINNLYMIDLSNTTFTTPFSLHLKNLIFRAQFGHFTNNPMAEAIKYNSPIVFDVAIYISLDLMDRFNITINEDEAAFLAMHIGAEIERQTANKYKVPAILVCPNYHDIASNILNTLLLNFGNQINLIGSVPNEFELEKIRKDKYFDIIFTTIPLHNHYKNTDIFQISPLNLSSQFEKIQNTITKNTENYKDHKLKINFHHFFEEDLFYYSSNSLCSKDKVLDHLCDKLLTKGYVETDFKEKVYRRENAATTAFGQVAIPHAVEMDAIKTSIAVAISKKGFQWNTNTVHIVLLLAINKADKQTFRNLYESLISLFGEDNMIQEIRNCTTFKEFEKLIYSRIDMKE